MTNITIAHPSNTNASKLTAEPHKLSIAIPTLDFNSTTALTIMLATPLSNKPGSKPPSVASSPASSAASSPILSSAPAMPLTTDPAPSKNITPRGATAKTIPITTPIAEYQHAAYDQKLTKDETRSSHFQNVDVTDLKKQLEAANASIQMNNAILYITNLKHCIDRLDNYVDAYTRKSRSFLGLFNFSFLGFHGAKGRKRAKDHCAEWKKTCNNETYLPFYKQVTDLLQTNKLTNDKLNELFKEAMSKVSAAANRSIQTLKGGNWHTHSYRAYLLAYSNEMKAFSDSAVESPRILKSDFNFGKVTHSKESDLIAVRLSQKSI
jgi:hypothetical protein